MLAGGGVWYQNWSSGVFIGPGYGDTPLDNGNLVLGNNQSSDTYISISPGAGRINLFANSGVYIGSESTAVQVNSDGTTYFNNNVYDKNGVEILGGNLKYYNSSDDTAVWIGPYEQNDLGSFEVNTGSQNYLSKNIHADLQFLYLHAGTHLYIGPDRNGKKSSDVIINPEVEIILEIGDTRLEMDETKLEKFKNWLDTLP